MLSRKASCDSHGQDSSYFLGWEEYEKNPYNELENPKGIIQMGLAENQLSVELPESWIAKNPDAMQLKENGESLFKKLALFQDYHGLPAFKNGLAKFMVKCRGEKVKYNPDHMVLTAGATSANETLMFCFAGTGDAFLVPTPYYPGFDRDLKWRPEMEIIPVHCSSSNDFKITVSALKEAYQHAQKLNLNVKGILITNPSNPLGKTLSTEELNTLINFAIEKEIHIVSDEVYSGTVYEPPSFKSILEALLDAGLQHTSMWNRVHIVYSLSKDLGLPGFRVGMIYSNNERVISACTKMSSFGLISSQTQHMLSKMLSDEDFTAKYIEENRKSLKKRKEMMVSGLRKAGIKCLESNSGLFCWVDMRQLLSSNTFQAENELWKDILYKVGLNISAGSSCHCSEPGWFRMCFANMSEETLETAMKRIITFVGRKRQLLKQRITLFLVTWNFWLSSSLDELQVSSD